jgi:Domain of unknown function (DUF3576)
MSRVFAALWVVVIVALGGCGYVETSPDSYRNPRVDPDAATAQKGSIFGGDGLNLLGGGKKTDQGGGSGIGVNSFLWRASLDTLAFMPLASADPFGGVIITDWYSPPETPDERFKVNLFILDRQLRSDGVRAAVFHQRLGAGGAWTDAAIEPATQTELENAILTRARQLRINTASN